MSRTSASVLPGFPNTRKHSRIMFECLEIPVKHEVLDIANVYAPPSFEQSPLLVIGSVQLS